MRNTPGRAAAGGVEGPEESPKIDMRLIGHSFSALMGLPGRNAPRAPLEALYAWEDIRSRSELWRYLKRLSLLCRPLVENIDMIRNGADADLLTARRYFLRLLGDEAKASGQSSETLFLFLLALVRTGQDDILRKIDAFGASPSAAQSKHGEHARIAS